MAKKKKRSAFVPRWLVRTAIVGVVPACALACGGNESSQAPADTSVVDGVADTAYPDSRIFAVADAAYLDTGRRDVGVADAAFGDTGSSETIDAPSEASDSAPDVFGVAAVAYPAYETGTPG